MLTIFSGTTQERAQAAQKIIAAEIKKGKQLISFSDASFQKESVLSYVAGADMFGAEYVVHLSRISERENGLEFLLNESSVLAASPTMYVVEENSISKELEKVFTDLKIKIAEYKEAKPNFFNSLTPFQLVDACNMRDKKNAWILLTKLFAAGVASEEIVGAMIWNYKNLALYFSKRKPTAASLDMKPFVFGKVSAAAQRFTKEEVEQMSFELSSLLHRSHRGQGDSATLLELFILKSL